MGRGLIPGTIWKILCHNLFITYFTLTFSKHLLLYTVCPFHRNSLFPSFNVNINFLSKNTSNNLEIVLVAVKWVEWYVRKASSFHIMQLNVKHNLKCCNCFQMVLGVFFDKKLILTLKEGKREFR
jgi:hypothetical protein